MSDQDKAKQDLARYALEDLRVAGFRKGKFYTDQEIYEKLFVYFKHIYPEKTESEIDGEVVDTQNFMEYA